jgi:hypothetical protein
VEGKRCNDSAVYPQRCTYNRPTQTEEAANEPARPHSCVDLRRTVEFLHKPLDPLGKLQWVWLQRAVAVPYLGVPAVVGVNPGVPSIPQAWKRSEALHETGKASASWSVRASVTSKRPNLVVLHAHVQATLVLGACVNGSFGETMPH